MNDCGECVNFSAVMLELSPKTKNCQALSCPSVTTKDIVDI